MGNYKTNKEKHDEFCHRFLTELELSYLDRLEPNLEKRKQLIPLTKKKDLITLILNLDVKKKELSGKEWKTILELILN